MTVAVGYPLKVVWLSGQGITFNIFCLSLKKYAQDNFIANVYIHNVVLLQICGIIYICISYTAAYMARQIGINYAQTGC